MNTKANKSLVKIYKDLLISKRELTDLRQSITKTIYGFRHPMTKNPATIQIKKKMCSGCGIFYEPAAAHQCKQLRFKCPNCPQYFPASDKLDKHLRTTHYQCKLCHDKPYENPAVHDADLCGQKRIDCEHCGAKIRRKDLDDHITRCCFQNCPKCQKAVYYKAFSYHVKNCQITYHKFHIESPSQYQNCQTTRKIIKKQPNSQQRKIQRFIPCSIKQ